MKTAVLGGALLLVGAILIATGVLPVPDAIAVAERVWPILLFVVAITVVTELAAEAELFRVVAERAARWGLRRSWLLWLFVVAIAIVSTVFLSLDTTAVLLTPVVILLARHVGLPPLPFALTTVWLANTASLLLPVSNLTNLLAQHALGGISPTAFAALMALPALAAALVPVVVLFVVFRKQLLTRYEPDAAAPAADRVLLVASAVVVVLLLPALVSGLPVWIPALVGAVILAGFFLVRRRSALRFGLVPWQLVVLASGLFLVIEAAHSLGLPALLTALAGHGEDPLSLLRLAGSAAAGANVVNNLPAYLAFESIADSPVRIAAVLVGVNAGCLITPWASLATLLWHDRLTALGVELSWSRYILLGLVVAPLTVAAATLALVI
ncbi:MAG: arsenic transporter [Micrococcales bacterium 70-64]|nr:arsenic transporter [Leifsonia sp.]ODU64498.1 MAG: arsenic transporter [Leifsonia sp. SCN 70-46]OJX86190.1 MAG: arsenic transporter [Micrococcales bacterium 70-64]